MNLTKGQALCLLAIREGVSLRKIPDQLWCMELLQLASVFIEHDFDTNLRHVEITIQRLVDMGLIWIDDDHRQHGRIWLCIKLTVEGHKLSQRYKLPREYLTRLEPVTVAWIGSRKIKKVKSRTEITLGRRFGVTSEGLRVFQD